MSHINPWIGWASYDEKALTEGYQFVGRTAETSELFSLIDNNLLVTLYGKSGIGKSSLLNAGVFPSLKAAGYEPIVCRCVDGDYPTFIINQVKAKCSLSSNRNIANVKNLVDFFKNTIFTKDNRQIYPVLVFDQFEDWFRINSEAALKLLRDISYLISDEYDGITNYRFVVSIREDYLYLLEDCIERMPNIDLKQNRYRLADLNKSQAEEIIDLGEVDPTVRDRLLQISKDSYGYNPGLLSFFCHELFEIYSHKINEKALENLENEHLLIEKYYNRCFDNKVLSQSTRKYIESHLQEDGLRRPQNIRNVEKHIPVSELEILLNGNKRLLRRFPVGDTEHVELIHDRIAEIINRRRTKSQELKTARLTAVTLLIYYIAIAFLIRDILSNLMHSAWAYMSQDHFKTYILQLISPDSIQWSIDFYSMKPLAFLQAYAYLLLVILIIVAVPYCICRFFYNQLSINTVVVNIILIIMAVILSSNLFLLQNFFANSLLLVYLGWGFIFIAYIINSIIIKRRTK